MVKGLELFKKHFAAYADQYVLIGGTACTLVMEKVGLEFRSTRDLDIVLCIEAVDQKFMSAFWEFIKKGDYHNKQKSSGKKIFYRFNSPAHPDFPSTIELFSRIIDKKIRIDAGHLQRIKINEIITSLSSILLDDEYYQFLRSGKCEIDGLSVVRASHLIPLKAHAWMDLFDKQKRGLNVDERDIRKHRNDILRLYQLLNEKDSFSLPASIKEDMHKFVDRLRKEESIDISNLGLKNSTIEKILHNLEQIYNLS